MALKIISRRRAAFLAKARAARGPGPGGRIRPKKVPGGRVPRPGRVDRSLVGTLRGKLAPGRGPFDLRKFREQPHDPALRD